MPLGSWKYKELNDYNFVFQNYVVLRKSTKQIAREIGCQAGLVMRSIKRNGIPKIDNSRYNKGRKFPPEHGMRVSASQKGRKCPWTTGKNNHGWKGGISPLSSWIKATPKYKEWRLLVYKKDGFTCQKCGRRGNSIEAHHIKPFHRIFQEFLNEYNEFSPIEDKETLVRLSQRYEPFWDITNGQVLCFNCHPRNGRNPCINRPELSASAS